MTLAAFDGAAGSGKTHSVMAQLAEELQRTPLGPRQRVLALTYMHGARHRLDEQLEKIDLLQGRYDASTIDSFAWTICRRWQSRLREYKLETPNLEDANAFDEVCQQAARLLEDADVREWVAASYPYLLVDEAQDLDASRLALVAPLVGSCCILLAFDEFQCLNSANRPVAVTLWIGERCVPKVLTGSRRTNVTDLLTAALQIRKGEPVTVDGPSFRITAAPATKVAGPVLAATLIAYQMLKEGTFALLSPAKSSSSPYVRDVVELLRTEKFGPKKDLGPFPIRWESGEETGAEELRKALISSPTHQYDEVRALLLAASGVQAAAQTAVGIRRLRDARGQVEFSAAEVVALFDRNRVQANQFGRRKVGRRRAMTLHQAKNREFDHVVILWPYRIPPDADDRRRLLYNGVTRAKKSCLVLVQSEKMLKEAPFV